MIKKHIVSIFVALLIIAAGTYVSIVQFGPTSDIINHRSNK